MSFKLKDKFRNLKLIHHHSQISFGYKRIVSTYIKKNINIKPFI